MNINMNFVLFVIVVLNRKQHLIVSTVFVKIVF
jgi:hypothetical protein